MARPLIGQVTQPSAPPAAVAAAGSSSGPTEPPRMPAGVRWYWFTAALLAIALTSTAAWWYVSRATPIRLWTPLVAGEEHAIGGQLYLDEDAAGKIVGRSTTAEGVAYLELEIGVSPSRRAKLKHGLVRLTGQRALWLTSEFIEEPAPPLVNGDVVPAVDPEQRYAMRWWKKLDSWLLTTGGVGVAWLFIKGCLRFRRR
ncbi:MAG TPA: hypothetical protein VEA63_09490 [Opitutus sp.]|nr:hypothetical protein [Opitutus sp.]